MRRVKDPQPGRIDSRDTPLQQRVAAHTILNRVSVGSNLLAHSSRNDLLRMKMLSRQRTPQDLLMDELKSRFFAQFAEGPPPRKENLS
jgi:hypothetical protein